MQRADDRRSLPVVPSLKKSPDPGHCLPRPAAASSVHADPAKLSVALVSMPFIAVDTPSIQLGLLKAVAASAGFLVENYHLYLDFAQQIGPARYAPLAQQRGRQVGDWLFSAAAFGASAPNGSECFIEDFRWELANQLQDLGERPLDLLRVIREREVPRYLDRMLRALEWGRFDVVGFTSTFQQSIASFALAARIKERFPHITTIFGGANFDGEMGRELVRSIDCIDYAISGEADEAFPEFLFALLEERDPADVAGVLTRREGQVVGSASAPFERLDSLPTPEYGDYFERAERLGLLSSASRRRVNIPFESSRGCWWGQKHHCTFCGLNGSTMGFRAKTPRRVMEELAELTQRHRSFRFFAVDNIFPISFLQDLFPQLVELGTSYTLFYETKANLRREQVALLAAAGVRCIQPGIESLSSHVLSLMRKGVKGIQNVNLLRWAAYHRICVIWNLIWGFPGETVEDYRGQSALIPDLVHLQPPLSSSRIWMERFSPVYADRDQFPTRRLAAEASYAYVYPSSVDRERVAYFFDYEFEQSLPDAVYQPVAQLARSWQDAWKRPRRPRLTFRASPGFVQVDDRRTCDAVATYSLVGPLASLYSGCSDSPTTVGSLKQKLGLDWPESKIDATLRELCVQGLMMREENLFLSLAVPESQEDEQSVEFG